MKARAANGTLNVSAKALSEELDKLVAAPVLIVGDVMLDEYFIGDAQRISPEAPVPVVLVSKERLLVGGAGNVARNIKDLGGAPLLVGACGDGHNSERLKSVLESEELPTSLVNLPGRPATTKTRIMARGQQMIRVDHEDCLPLSDAETDQILAVIEEHWPRQKVLIISDYNKGVVNRRLMQGIADIRAGHANEVKILVDPKTGNFDLYKNVSLLTPNTKETGEGAGLPVRTREEIIRAGQEIFRKLDCAELLTTLGAEGMALFHNPEKITHIPTISQQVFDVTGAGDTVIGTVGQALAAGFSMLQACVIANYAAGLVVAKVGSATTNLEELRKSMQTMQEPPLEEWAV